MINFKEWFSDSKRIFDNMVVANFMGFVIKRTTADQIRTALNTHGISFRETASFFGKDEIIIAFTYKSGNIDWNCQLSIKNNVLNHITLSNYSPDSYNTFKILCKELTERYGSTYNVTSRYDKQEGTETLCFGDKTDWSRFTEVKYDSSPILGTKNVYISYFNM